MKRISLLVVLACATVLALAPSAVAKPRCQGQNNVPPGNSEVDQYSETVPGDCGENRPPTPNESDDPAESIPPATLAALEDLGADGRAAALLAAAGDRENGLGGGSGAPDGGASGVSTDTPLGDTPAILDSDDGGFFDPLFDALSGEGGLGFVVPLTLAVVLALAITAFVRARRSA